MKVTHYQQMMAYLTRPGYDKGGKVLPKKKPQEEIKRRSRINYEKLKKYLDPESQMFIEKELGFAEGGGVNPLQLKQRFMQLVSSIQDAEPEEIPGIVAEAKQIKDQIDSLNQDLAPERQIKLTAEGLQFDNPLVDAVNIQRLVEPIQPVKKSIASLTEDNPVLANVFKRSIEGLEDSEEKQAFMKASMKMDTGETFDKIKNIFKSAEPDSYPEIKTEDEFAMGGSVETPKRGLVDEPGSYAGLEKFEIEKINNPSDEALNEIRQIIDNLDIKQNNILGKEVRNLPKEITVEKLVKQIKTPGYKRPTIAKELLKRVLNEKNIKTYDNYRTEKIVTVLNNALDINKGDTLRIKPSAAVKLLPEFEVKNIKGGGGNSILKTYRNYIAGGERIGSRAGIPVPKEIGGRNLADIVTDLDRNFLDVTGGRSVGDMKILNEIKLLDRLANENPNVSATKLKELFEEAGGTNFQGRLVKIHPVKMGNLTEGDTGVILKKADE